MTQAIVLFAHGSRDALWRKPLDAVAGRIRVMSPGAQVECAFLELMTPDLPACIAGLAAGGARAITVVPMFLGVGKHAREDLPDLIEQVRHAHPGIAITLQPAVGENPALIDLLAKIALS